MSDLPRAAGSFSLGEDQREVQALVRRIAAERVAPRAAAIDCDAAYPQDMFDLLRKLGLFTLPFPPAYGGSGSVLSGCSNSNFVALTLSQRHGGA